MFVLFGNMLGMLPYAFTFTSHIMVTLTLALVVFVVVTGVALMLRGSRIGGWKSKPSPLEQASIRTMKETGVNPV